MKLGKYGEYECVMEPSTFRFKSDDVLKKCCGQNPIFRTSFSWISIFCPFCEKYVKHQVGILSREEELGNAFSIFNELPKPKEKQDNEKCKK